MIVWVSTQNVNSVVSWTQMKPKHVGFMFSNGYVRYVVVWEWFPLWSRLCQPASSHRPQSVGEFAVRLGAEPLLQCGDVASGMPQRTTGLEMMSSGQTVPWPSRLPGVTSSTLLSVPQTFAAFTPHLLCESLAYFSCDRRRLPTPLLCSLSQAVTSKRLGGYGLTT